MAPLLPRSPSPRIRTQNTAGVQRHKHRIQQQWDSASKVKLNIHQC